MFRLEAGSYVVFGPVFSAYYNVTYIHVITKYFWSDMSLGALIMTYSRPLLRPTYEHIPLHTFSICQTFFNSCGNRTQDLSITSHLP